TDFIFMVEQTSHMFITGPEVIKTVTGEDITFEALGGAAAHSSRSGVAHFAAPDEPTCIQQIRTLLSYLPSNNLEDPPRLDPPAGVPERDPDLDGLVPVDPNKPYDVRDVVRRVVDPGSFLE